MKRTPRALITLSFALIAASGCASAETGAVGGGGAGTTASSSTTSSSTSSTTSSSSTSSTSSTTSSSSSTSSTSSTTSSSTSSTTSSSSTTGTGTGDVAVSIAGLGLYIDCAKTGADQLQGTVSVNFGNTSGVTETVTLTSGKATIHNGSKQMDVTLALAWSAANSQPPGQIPAGGVNGIIYKEQTGAPAPPMNPCSFCPVNNNNVSPSLDVTLTWDHAGNTLTDTSSTAVFGCLNMF